MGPGGRVRQGPRSGFAGSTRRSPGEHLHYQILLDTAFGGSLKGKVPPGPGASGLRGGRWDRLAAGRLHGFLAGGRARPRPVGGVVALVGEPLAGGRLEAERDLALVEQPLETLHLDIEDAANLAPLEPVE